jgi:hypothetical protein
MVCSYLNVLSVLNNSSLIFTAMANAARSALSSIPAIAEHAVHDAVQVEEKIASMSHHLPAHILLTLSQTPHQQHSLLF